MQANRRWFGNSVGQSVGARSGRAGSGWVSIGRSQHFVVDDDDDATIVCRGAHPSHGRGLRSCRCTLLPRMCCIESVRLACSPSLAISLMANASCLEVASRCSAVSEMLSVSQSSSSTSAESERARHRLRRLVLAERIPLLPPVGGSVFLDATGCEQTRCTHGALPACASPRWPWDRWPQSSAIRTRKLMARACHRACWHCWSNQTD